MADPQVNAMISALNAQIAAAAKALALEVTANLVEATPVDTNHARANWIASVGSPPAVEVPGTSNAAREGSLAKVLSYKLGDGPIFASNNAAYIDYLLAGSSSQAAPGWDLAAIDRAVATVQRDYDVRIELGDRSVIATRGKRYAENLASAYSPVGGDDD